MGQTETPVTTKAWDEAVAVVLSHAARSEFTGPIAELLARLLPPYVRNPLYQQFFPFFQSHGTHITAVHFYQPIPDTRLLPDELWHTPGGLPGVDLNEPFQLHLLQNGFPSYRDEYDEIPHDSTGNP